MSGDMVDTWIGDGDDLTLGFVHRPADGTARGGVVICAPLGYEHFNAYRAMRYLSQELAAVGVASVRFDYAGQGDAAGDSAQPNAGLRWVAGITQAVELLRTAGVERIALVGLSSGALLAHEAALLLPHVSEVVLWDPALSGRRFLRRQQSLHELTVGTGVDPDPEQVLLLSAALHRSTADWLGQLQITPEAIAARPSETLLLGRRVDTTASATLRFVRELSPNAEYRAIDGQEQLLDVPSALAEIPVDAVATITRWLGARMPCESRPLTPQVRTEAVVGYTDDGTPIVERISRSGPHKLFVVETTVDPHGRAGRDDTCGLVVMQPAAAEHRAGAGRLQVRAARELAARGHRAIRYDRRITGDSTEVRPGEQSLVLAEAWVTDADALVADLAGTSPVALMGVCSGAWVAARIAEPRAARLTVLVGPNYYRTQALPPDEYVRRARHGEGRVPRFARIKGALRDAIPDPLWRIAGSMPIFNNPAALLAGPVGIRPSTVALLLTPEDSRTYANNRGPDAAARLRRDGADIRVTDYPFGDHALLGEDVQNAALADLLRLVDENLPAVLTVTS